MQIWIDGGWCIDALVGRQVRDHDDLDIAVQRRDAARLTALLHDWQFTPDPRAEDSPWCFVLRRGEVAIDIHVFEFDDAGNHVYGIEYPFASLTGTGQLNGTPVRCVAPEWAFRFKTSFPPRAKDLVDVAALSEAFGFALPVSHQRAGAPG